LTQFALLIAAAAVLAQSQNPLPGPPASGVDGGIGPNPTVLPGGVNSLPGTPIRGTDASRYSPFETDLTMDMTDARREKLALYFTAQFQKKNVADTNRLVTLARELNAATEKTGNPPTAEEIKKVEEIAKLARRVRERLTAP
jgi:hypothetical protein